jgi:predicted nucleic acid-binding protein
VLVAAADRKDPHYDACARLLEEDEGPLITTALVVAEAAYLLERELRRLHIWGPSPPNLSPVGAIRKLRHLLIAGDGLAEVAALPELSFIWLAETQTEVDVSPFAGRRLTLNLLPGARVTGLDRLGRGARIHDYRRES